MAQDKEATDNLGNLFYLLYNNYMLSVLVLESPQ